MFASIRPLVKKIANRPAVRPFVRWADPVLVYVRFAYVYARFLVNGTNGEAGMPGLRKLFCLTNGRSNNALGLLHRTTHKPYPIDPSGGLVPGLDEAKMRDVVRALDRDGYYNFGRILSDADCDALTRFALTTPFKVLGEGGFEKELRVYDPARPAGVAYHVVPQTLLEQETAQRVVSDLGLLAIAQQYFRAKAVQDHVTMWWSTASREASSIAAQLYHFDMDRVKFLKFFFYLTDVTEDTGPHHFVKGTHRDIPAALRLDRRLTDDEVFAAVPRDREVVFTGPRGTLFAEDTRGLHKGQPVARGHRLVLEFEYAINMFGYYYPPIYTNEMFSPAFLDTVRRYPYAFANYTAGGSAPAGLPATPPAMR